MTKSCASCERQIHEEATVCAHCHRAQPPQWYDITGIRLSMDCYASIRATAIPTRDQIELLIEALQLQVKHGAYDESSEDTGS